MRRMASLMVCLATLQLSLVFQAHATVLKVREDGERFSLDGQDVFLLGISYYGALSVTDRLLWIEDLEDMRRDGINWIRVWAFWKFPAKGGENVSALERDGSLRQPHADRLEDLVRMCDRLGFVVDVTFSRDADSQGVAPQDQDSHRVSCVAMAQRLLSHRNVYFDVANERDVRDGRYVSLEEVGELIEAIKSVDPDRLCTASCVPGSQEHLAEILSKAKLDFIAPHLCRDQGCADKTQSAVEQYRTWMQAIGKNVPIHFQEPFRRGYGRYEPDERDFLRDFAGAVAGKAAGWCFHNGAHQGERPFRSFLMDSQEGRLYNQLDAVDKRALAGLKAVNVPLGEKRSEWLAEGSFGIMVHYLISPPGDTDAAKTEAFNRTVDGFDLDEFMRQFEATGADWLIFTLGQNTGYYCSPNGFLDERLPGHTSRRDLALEIAQRVKTLRRRFIAYLPSEVNAQTREVHEAFGWNPGDQSLFQQNYQAFVRDYAIKFGPLLDGWWFDGCYEWPVFHNSRYDWPAWMAASRAGNLQAIVAFNDGAFCVNKVKPVTPLEDYHAGEVHQLVGGKIKLGHEMDSPLYLPESQYIDGVQWHALVPVDSSFEGGKPYHYSDDELFGFIDACKAVRGAVTLNLPIGADGIIPTESASQMQRLGQRLSKNPFEADIRRFEEEDRAMPPPQGANLFVGSSSIRRWDLQSSFPNHLVINRGFGGSQISDSLAFVDRIIVPYHPKVIVFYAGDNDIAAGESPEAVFGDFKALVRRVRAGLPEAKLAFISVKPSRQRWALAGPMKRLNQMVRDFVEGDDHLVFIDVWQPMLRQDGQPRQELLAEDGLHLSERGYRVWNGLVEPVLVKGPGM